MDGQALQTLLATRTALLLLGKAESAYMLSPHPAQLTWKLAGEERAYEHFGPPFLLSSTLPYRKIRNVQLRILPEDQLIPVEVAKYDRKIVLEALHNCVAHQDYTRNGRILVTERADRVVLESEGGFFDGRPDDYVAGNRTPRRYRNPFLAQAMSELSMIDTMGYGIHSIRRPGQAIFSAAGLRFVGAARGQNHTARRGGRSCLQPATDPENRPAVGGHSGFGSGTEKAAG